ncbi:zinc metalloproteinase nas-15-like [Amphibalanus amphitrite]|uniref:zinc metalloproteinase nas-15-like n=1 Tax=Amphibalanus amphitrite TaxID=1232801 RepID=UPI001C912A4D|nr:zinc metalloproteinase nas-15-like [Amphibalanus amphitrite]
MYRRRHATLLVTLLVTLLSFCAGPSWSAVLPGLANRSTDNCTTPVSLNSVLLSVARSPEVTDETDDETSPLSSRLGPFGQIPELDNRDSFSKGGTVIFDTSPLTPQDFERAENLVEQPSDADIDDLMYQEEYFQGDIVMPVSDFVALNEDNAVVETSLWPGGRIYYTMSGRFTTHEKSVIASAVKEFERRTCIRVIPLTPGYTEYDHVHVTKDEGCFSSVGKKGGRQELSLGQGCIFKGIVMHEFMHAAGFWHEQSRPDRDDFVRVHYDNIKPLMRFNFKKYEWGKVPNLGLSYDIGSIMHYGPYAFARDKTRPTLTALRSAGNGRMGQRDGFSSLDVQKLNSLYGCGGTKPKPPPPPPPPTPKPTVCEDTNNHCEYWATRGECSRNPKYMLQYCKRSCKECGDCRDMNKSCLSWAERGECGRNPSYMHVYCRLSCSLCQAPPKPPPSPCKDNNSNCAGWASAGECYKNPSYMLVVCKLSCNKC